MLSIIMSFFGGKLQFGIVVILGIALLGLGFLYGFEKYNHSNTKIYLANSLAETESLKTQKQLLIDSQLKLSNVIDGLKLQVQDCQKDFIDYKKKSENMIKICTEAKEIPQSQSELNVLDRESNEKYIKEINSALGF